MGPRRDERGIIDVPCPGTNRKMNDLSTAPLPANFRNAFFLQSASAIENAPADLGWEVAFAGRSNSGKSSAINTLLVDLPGYGFDKVPLSVNKKWNQQLERYLQHRQSLRGLVMLMDIRHPLTEPDQQMLGWAITAAMPVHILLTKADKLKRGPAQNTLLSVRKQLASHAELVSVQLFSSLKGVGVDALGRQLNQWLTDESVLEADEKS